MGMMIVAERPDSSSRTMKQPQIEDRLLARKRPQSGSLLRMRWEQLLFLHWAWDPAEIQKTLPRGLFVDTFNGQAWLDRAGNHASPALHVVERYKFAGPDAIDYSATLEDPKTFSRSWSMHFRLFRNPDPHEHLMEFKCVLFTEELLYGEFYKRSK